MSTTEFGFAAPGGRRILGFQNKFFDVNSTVVRRTQLHTIATAGGLECSRAGAVVHELSHVFLDTKDEKLPNAAYLVLGRAVPTGSTGRHDSYGPFACAGLAQAAPDIALTNADTYRLFCEDAQVQYG